MATEKQLIANRLNALKCTGPVTEEGKARSSQNALKTGIDSQAEVMERENRDEYTELIAAFHAQFAPANIEEQCYVDSLVRFEWLSRRYMNVEAETWKRRFHEQDSPDVGRAFLREGQQIARASMLLRATRKAFNDTVKQLRHAQADRPADVVEIADQEPEASENDSDNKPFKPELVSFLETSFNPHLTQPDPENVDIRPHLAA